MPEPTQSPIMESRTIFTAGLLIRSEMATEIRNFLFTQGADYTMDEDRGWTESTYYLTIRGPKADALSKSVRSWIKKIEDET